MQNRADIHDWPACLWLMGQRRSAGRSLISAAQNPRVIHKYSGGGLADLDEMAFRDMAGTQLRHWWFRARREILSDRIAALRLPAGATILEVGAGTGGNLAMLATHGQVTAVEKDTYARKFAAEHSGLFVLPGYLPDKLPLADVQHNLICLFDVLEHINDDRGSLVTLRSRLSADGRLLITVPAYQWLFGHHDQVLHHYRRYTLSGLRQLLADCGYQIESATYFNTLLFPVVALTRLLGIFSGSTRDVGNQIPSTPINNLLYHIFRLELHLLRHINMAFGTSIIICARLRQ